MFSNTVEELCNDFYVQNCSFRKSFFPKSVSTIMCKRKQHPRRLSLLLSVELFLQRVHLPQRVFVLV